MLVGLVWLNVVVLVDVVEVVVGFVELLVSVCGGWCELVLYVLFVDG